MFYKEIGERIRDKRTSLGIKAKDIDSELAEDFGLSPFTVRSFREYVEFGLIYGTASHVAIMGAGGKRNLNRLSLYLDRLDFEADDPVIGEIRKIDERFAYPPPEDPDGFTL
jgi:hypothetical protein